MKNSYLVLILLIAVSCSPKISPEITSDEMKRNLEFLASDQLMGRQAGEKGDLEAAEFIRSKFKKAGLELLYHKGFQKFGLVTSAKIDAGNTLSVDGNGFHVEKDFLPYAFSSNTEVSGKAVFAGYGLDIERDTLKWSDYKGIDAEGKWVIAFQGDPDMDNAHSPFVEFSSERSKALVATDKKAAGLILVAPPKFSDKDELSPLFFDKNSSRYPIPVIQVTRAVADKILEGTGKTIASLEKQILENKKSVSVEAVKTIKAAVNVSLVENQSQNVVAKVTGNDPVLKNEVIVVGAHFDHLGMGGPGSGSRMVDTIAVHNGADDNGSGVVTIIELAEKIAREKQNRRTVIFVAFGAEEMGLVGSKAFTANPPVDINSIKAMFNFDMVGRFDSKTKVLSISGTKTAVETEKLLNDLNPGFSLAFSEEGIGPSDHASFYLRNIPVFFVSTGAHPDYHTPNDDVQFINFEGTKMIADYAYKLITDVANRNQPLTFQEAGSKFQRSRGGRFKVTLGVMPDYAGLEKRGMRIDGVTKGKPAEKGGLKQGDIITAIDGKKIGSIYDYMDRLKTLEAGKTISVDFIRDNKEMVLIIQL